jgi:hypothetical protein
MNNVSFSPLLQSWGYCKRPKTGLGFCLNRGPRSCLLIRLLLLLWLLRLIGSSQCGWVPTAVAEDLKSNGQVLSFPHANVHLVHPALLCLGDPIVLVGHIAPINPAPLVGVLTNLHPYVSVQITFFIRGFDHPKHDEEPWQFTVDPKVLGIWGYGIPQMHCTPIGLLLVSSLLAILLVHPHRPLIKITSSFSSFRSCHFVF